MNKHKNLIKKVATIALLLFISFAQMNAQDIKKYYNRQWKECQPNEARFLSITTKTDSGYYRKDYYIRERRLQMAGLYADSLCKIQNGSFAYYHSNGMPLHFERFKQNKKEGVAKSYYRNGCMADSAVYHDGKIVGVKFSWHKNGCLRDSISLQEEGNGVSVSWFDNGMPSSTGHFSKGMKQDGKWMFFHRNGKVSAIEKYDQSKLVDKQYFNEQGELMKDTTNNDRVAQFKGGVKGFMKYIKRKVRFPNQYRIANGNKAVVEVSFTINEEGNIENVYTITSFAEPFDKEVETAILKSPRWQPARNHNRTVKQKYKIPVVFKN